MAQGPKSGTIFVVIPITTMVTLLHPVMQSHHSSLSPHFPLLHIQDLI
ncbi:hypothetical protein V3595_02415 [Bacillus sp. CFBP9009]